MRLLLIAGERCAQVMDAKTRDLHPRYLELDEIWAYVQKTNRRARKGDSPEIGDPCPLKSALSVSNNLAGVSVFALGF